ncbi:uncharacterized protein DS421_15g491500 [Arachis hypogaea]|nr:uncharacterized protein DS421_15g491500 [Arachis hypogaea]
MDRITFNIPYFLIFILSLINVMLGIWNWELLGSNECVVSSHAHTHCICDIASGFHSLVGYFASLLSATYQRKILMLPKCQMPPRSLSLLPFSTSTKWPNPFHLTNPPIIIFTNIWEDLNKEFN